MLSRSSTSSPDILGPTGDSDYLISSPFKPFRGRQSAMSPNLKVLQTPGTVKAKAPRFSLSPSKSAHSIRFDDVLLPVSPHMKLNPAQRALSPDKDGNQSPWRIRVTLEATQDEDEAQGSPARKRARPSTMTTKIPLKDESEQTPRRRRGRPRKSDVIEASATPTPAPPTGSPGHTPGPAGHTPAPVGASGQKRKRGRPRKSQLQIEAPETNGQGQEEQAQDEQTQNEPAQDEQPDTQEVELPVEEPTPIAEPTRSWSPLNIAAENDDDFDDELPDAPDPFDFADHEEEPAETNPHRSSPRVTFDTPNVDTIDDAYLRIGEPNLDSTPSKMPSPPREEVRSPENSLHAGHTPMPPRRYPTPNSSSQTGDERHSGPGAADPALDVPDHANGPISADPTDEHREFDSIMESEGFSMVSLDTLPSAKQHGLSMSSDLMAKKGSLKPFMNKEITTSSKRKPRFTRDETSDKENAEGDSPAVIERQSHLRTHSNTSNPAVRYPSLHDRHSSPRNMQSPPAAIPAATAAPSPPRVPVKQRPLARLVKLVRAGIELGHVLFNSFEFPPQAELYALQGRGPDLEAPIRRLERLFIDFDPEIQRRLHMSLDFGHEIARIRILDEIDAEIEARELVPSSPRESQNDRAADGSATPYAPEDLDRTPHETPNSEMRRRMKEWQQERDAISREIQLANSSQVIVIDSDASGHPSPDNQDNYYEDGFDSDQDSVAELEQPLEREVPQTDDPADDIGAEEEDGYEDIWQQEAHDQDSPSDRSDAGDYHQTGDQLGPESSPWKGTDYAKSSPASWTNEHDKVPSLGPSRVSQLREQDVDLSGLLREKYTPKRSRYYYGKSSPFSTASGRSPERSPERAQPSEPQIKEEEYEAVEEQDRFEEDEYDEEAMGEPEHQAERDFRSDNYLETSPHRFSDDDAFQVDPTTRFENSLHNPDSPAGVSDDGSFVYAARSEQPSAQKTHDITPQRSQAGSADAPPSTWFQRIASLTPGWLKAPNRKQSEQPEPSVEGQSEYGHDEPTPSKEPSYNEEDNPRPVEDAEWEETPRPARQSTTSSRDRRSSFQPSSGNRSRNGRTSLDAIPNGQAYDRPPPLSVSGYFSDEHYYLLRRLYRAAIKFPERFPYYPAPGRSDIIGDWIWTSDGTYGVPITERQFAIIDRFVQELAKTDIQAGGTGQVSWTEADLHRRLISIIIGEQIRAEAKEQQQQQQQQAEPPKTQTSTIRGLTSRLWR